MASVLSKIRYWGVKKVRYMYFTAVMGDDDDALPPVTPPQSPLLALTPTEYNNTIADFNVRPNPSVCLKGPVRTARIRIKGIDPVIESTDEHAIANNRDGLSTTYEGMNLWNTYGPLELEVFHGI